MTRTKRIIYDIIAYVAALALLFTAIYIKQESFGIVPLLFTLLGAVVVSILNSFFHEAGHLIVAKARGFYVVSMSFLFFKFYKQGGKTHFKFSFSGESAGYTEMLPKTDVNLAKRFYSVTLAGPFFNLILVVLGVMPYIFKGGLSVNLYCLLAAITPISAYFFLDNVLPKSFGGVRNDGGVAYGIRKNDDVSKVTLNVLKIQSELYNGKSPAEVDRSLYFDLPQICEEESAFLSLLSVRYLYYLDECDYENAEKVTERMRALTENATAATKNVVLKYALYNACTFDFNEEKADEYMYEAENYLNADNDAESVRIKTAYLLYVKKETENLPMFFDKLYREIDKIEIEGLKKFELKLAKKLKAEYEKIVGKSLSEAGFSESGDSEE